MPRLPVNGIEVCYRDEGRGPAVVLGHSSSATGGQWRRLMERMRNRYRLLAPDFLGYGKTPALHPGANLLESEIAVLESMLAARRTIEVLRRNLPNHDYGEIAAAGHMSPLTHPDRVNPIVEAHIVENS